MALRTQPKNDYPTSDGRPMAETDLHRLLMTDLISTLTAWFADVPDAYVTGNLLLCYEQGDKRRHVAPDVFVAFGVGKHVRENYLLWEEVPPAIVIELTSASTHREDVETKMELYRDRIGVAEYILFDPDEDYLEPSLQGYSLVNGEYQPMALVEDRLYSQQLGLFFERDGRGLRFVDPVTGETLPTPIERAERAEQANDTLTEERDHEAQARRQAEAERDRETEARHQAETEREQESRARQQVEAERDALQRELAELRQRLNTQSP